MIKRLTRAFALSVALCLLAVGMQAQTILDNPSFITFTASTDHLLLTRYEARFVNVSTGATLTTVSLGLPTPVNGTITVALDKSAWVTGVTYRVDVRSVHADGRLSAWSTALKYGRVPATSGGGTGTTRTAADCQLTSVQATVNSAVDTDIVVVPAGTCAWTGMLTITKAITLRGAGALSSTDGGAATTGSDLTVILDRNPVAQHTLISVSVPSGKVARITGLKIQMDGLSVGTQGGLIVVSGGANSVRIDHNHFITNADGSITIAFYAQSGVVDHNYFDAAVGNGPFGIYLQNGTGYGDAAWSSADNFGTNQFLFVEDNRWRNGNPGDANTGGQRFIYRYNTGIMESADVNSGYIANHGLTPDRKRSTRAVEYYGNVFSSPAGRGNSPYTLNGGTGRIWGNTTSNYYYTVILSYQRVSSTSYNYGVPPTGWGTCNGTAGVVWDGPSGYPCLDQVGRGSGDLLSGTFPSIVNTRTGTAAYVQQALSPVYVWGNSVSGTVVSVVSVWAGGIAANREFYQQFGAFGEAGSFDGTHGVGQGLLAARTGTCTTGVGYWATDAGGNWNTRNATSQDGALYICTSTNVWTLSYTPYAYPHPLTQ